MRETIYENILHLIITREFSEDLSIDPELTHQNADLKITHGNYFAKVMSKMTVTIAIINVYKRPTL